MSTTHLLTHLQNAQSTVPLPTLLAALSHHLSVDTPTPTTLSAAAISSPFFLVQPETRDKLQGLLDAFRHAVHLKHEVLIKAEKEGWGITRALFSKSIQWGLSDWIQEALQGVQGGRAVLRLACCSGLLLGAKGAKGVNVDVDKVEDEIVVALAEVLDAYAHSNRASEWEKEFRPREYEIPLALALILASQSVPLLPLIKLKALPLSFLAHLLTSTICSAFHDGTFLESSDQILSKGPIHVLPTSPLAERVKAMSSSPIMAAIASLSKLTAVVLGALINSSAESLLEAAEVLDAFRWIAVNVERDWKTSPFASVRNEDEIAFDTRDLSQSIWLLLKTLLFSTIMVADGVLASAIFVRPKNRSTRVPIIPQILAQSTLQTLFHISFVVSQLGGVTATATGDDQGFKELRRVFYLAIDVLSSDIHSNNIGDDVNNICEDFIEVNSSQTPSTMQSFDQAKTAYVLACMEQLVPQLGVRCLRDYVWSLCLPYLTDSSHRETFESAHSVVLAIFASHAQQQQSGLPPRIELPETPNHLEANAISKPKDDRLKDARDYQVPGTPVTRNPTPDKETYDSANFVQQTIPFYTQCLIENSGDNKLSTPQLRLAYAALVQAASASATTFGTTPDGSFSLAWYCVESLLDMIRKLTPAERGTGIGKNVLNEAQLHRLHLTLISTVASLPLPLMVRALEEIRYIITAQTQSDGDVPGVGGSVEAETKKELVKALFTEILEGVGDREKEAAMRWWYTNRQKMVWGVGDNTITYAEGKGMEKMEVAGEEDSQTATGIVSRL
ncbi:hypothetical protein BDZ94DRAFT_1159342 [Collybia nuda]|uniref:Peroxisomal membrane protein PEX17 n=1 Tax=Collybia nuda TaxID=64659 RepID=A0A9P6CMJ4_9AGAR|nr:hypothetical protein BDZ94DRAFT_1159342 [Collybia nuda]